MPSFGGMSAPTMTMSGFGAMPNTTLGSFGAMPSFGMSAPLSAPMSAPMTSYAPTMSYGAPTTSYAPTMSYGASYGARPMSYGGSGTTVRSGAPSTYAAPAAQV